jgi:membrane-bound lytic murein transglycosylase D
MKALFNSRKFYFISGILSTLIFIVFAGSIYTGRLQVQSVNAGNTTDETINRLFPQDYKIISPAVPDELSFAGEMIPSDRFDIKERIERELITNTYWHSFTILAIKRSARYFPVIEPILKENGIPDDFKYIAVIESGLANVVSPAGAAGIWQLMKDAAEQYGLEVGSEVDERYHLEKATKAACEYLRTAHIRFNNWTLAAASYNMGMAGVSRQLERQFTDDYYELHLNEETSRYIARVIALKEIMNNPPAYGFALGEEDLYLPLQHYPLEIVTPIESLADFSRKKGISYKMLKLYNPWLRDIKLSGKSGRKYTLHMPIENYPQ